MTSLYQSILGRNPEPLGLNAWIVALNDGATRANVAKDIYNSPEAVYDRAHKLVKPIITEAAALAKAQAAQKADGNGTTTLTTSSVSAKAVRSPKVAVNVRPAQDKTS